MFGRFKLRHPVRIRVCRTPKDAIALGVKEVFYNREPVELRSDAFLILMSRIDDWFFVRSGSSSKQLRIDPSKYDSQNIEAIVDAIVGQ